MLGKWNGSFQFPISMYWIFLCAAWDYVVLVQHDTMVYYYWSSNGLVMGDTLLNGPLSFNEIFNSCWLIGLFYYVICNCYADASMSTLCDKQKTYA
jgi:hypothetical protein